MVYIPSDGVHLTSNICITYDKRRFLAASHLPAAGFSTAGATVLLPHWTTWAVDDETKAVIASTEVKIKRILTIFDVFVCMNTNFYRVYALVMVERDRPRSAVGSRREKQNLRRILTRARLLRHIDMRSLRSKDQHDSGSESYRLFTLFMFRKVVNGIVVWLLSSCS